MSENEGCLLEYLYVELSLVSLTDSIPHCCALLVQLGCPLVGLGNTLALTVEKPEMRYRSLRLELSFVSQLLCDNLQFKKIDGECAPFIGNNLKKYVA